MALWLGPLVLIVFLTFALPAQVNGWGYRYLAGFLGNAFILAGRGWEKLERDGVAPAREFLLATAVAVLIVLPIHVWMAAGHIGAYAKAARAIQSIDADVVIVDEGLPFASDLVLNRADLSNRPILLSRNHLQPKDIPAICMGRTIGFADAPQLGSISGFFRIPVPVAPTPRQSQLKAAAMAAHCRMAAPVTNHR